MENKKGISGSTLKMIAIVTMVIDHIGAAVLARLLMVNGLGELDQTNADAIMQWLSANGALYWTYTIMRMIGRVAFPIFCFLLVEGFLHTHDVKKYAMRLGLFALLSEIPFDLAFSSKILEFNYQNVFFTLFIGLLTMIAYRAVEEKEEWNQALKVILYILIVAAGMALAYFLKTDYAEKGKFSYVLAWKSNRMGRNMMQAMVNESRLMDCGIKVYYAEEDFDDSAAGRFALRSMMNVNQFY